MRRRRLPTGHLLRTALVGTLVAGLTATVAPVALAAPAGTTRETIAGGQRVTAPRLVARATLDTDYLAPGPPSGAAVTPANGRRGPFDGQVVPGFSAAVANGDGTFWAMPDNGFGTKENSEDFRLRIYLVKPRWETRSGGRGEVEVLRHLQLSDPDRKVDFPIVNENGRRWLTGADFDIESLQRMPDGSFWIGEEFGPFLLHVDRRGRVLSAPVSFPLGGSPQNPDLDGAEPTVPRSGGFEAMARSTDSRYLYPIVEKALAGAADPRARVVAQFDTRRQRYTGRTWTYRVDTDSNLVADAAFVSRNTLYVLERDDYDGEAAVTKRVYAVDLRRTERPSGTLAKRLVVDLLDLDNPDEIGEGDASGGSGAGGPGWGTGDPFSFGFVSVETIVPLPGGRLLVANDTNYPGNAARRPGTPDDTEMIVVDLRAKRRAVEHPHTKNGATVIAHRGASGYRPEHTLAAYALAIRQCADYIEPDVVMTKDGVAVARHENEISGTTNVADRPEFADRRTTKTIDGAPFTGWFTEDFTLAELRTLRAKERLPLVRPQNTPFDGLYQVPTLAEVFDLARHSRTCSGKPVGVAPETKHPTYFRSIGLPIEPALVRELRAAGLNSRRSPVVVQSFETGNLRRLNEVTPVRLAQLVNCSGAPYDLVAAGDPRTYADLTTAAGLREVSRYADIAAFCKDVMIPRDATGALTTPTTAIRDAHRAGLEVVGWTFRRENQFLPLQFRRGTDPNAVGDLAGEIRVFLAAGMDSFFTDNPDIGAAVAGERRRAR